MTAHEILKFISAERTGEVLSALRELDRRAYKTVFQLLAQRRRLRPLFLERKQPVERHAWMKEALSWATNEDLAREVLQIWLLGKHREMVCEFLDFLAVPHDGKGLFETLPTPPEEARLQRSIDQLLAKYPCETVSIYLHLFSELEPKNWSQFQRMVKAEGRLCLGTMPLKEPAVVVLQLSSPEEEKFCATPAEPVGR